jgi:hypothetical protein
VHADREPLSDIDDHLAAVRQSLEDFHGSLQHADRIHIEKVVAAGDIWGRIAEAH